MSPDEFDLFLTYLYLFSNKCVKDKLSFFWISLMFETGCILISQVLLQFVVLNGPDNLHPHGACCPSVCIGPFHPQVILSWEET
jgi:hypothetical protein